MKPTSLNSNDLSEEKAANRVDGPATDKAVSTSHTTVGSGRIYGGSSNINASGRYSHA